MYLQGRESFLTSFICPAPVQEQIDALIWQMHFQLRELEGYEIWRVHMPAALMGEYVPDEPVVPHKGGRVRVGPPSPLVFPAPTSLFQLACFLT